jgi:hypothetical protein
MREKGGKSGDDANVGKKGELWGASELTEGTVAGGSIVSLDIVSLERVAWSCLSFAACERFRGARKEP